MAKAYYINDIKVSQPVNWESFEMKISRDRELRITLEEFDEELIFTDEGYSILFDIMCAGICDVVDIRVFEDCINDFEFQGVIILAESKFSDCAVEAKVRNESLFYKIDANKGADHYIGTANSPNGSIIETYPPEAFENSDTDEEISMYRLIDVIKHTISYVSDGRLEFKSSFLENNFSDLYITNGSRLRSGAQTGVELSLQQIIDEVFTFFNLWTDIVYINGKLTYVAERYSYHFKNEILNEFPLRLVTFSANEEVLFSNLSIRSEFDDSPNFAYGFQHLGFVGDTGTHWGTLNITNGIDCTNSSSLSLEFKWIRDHNIIQDIIINKNEQFDSDILFIDKAHDEIFPKPFSETLYYNERLKNSNLINYWSSYLSANGFPVKTLTPILSSYIANLDDYPPQGGDTTAGGDPFYTQLLTDFEEADLPEDYYDLTEHTIAYEKKDRIPYVSYGTQWDNYWNRRMYITPSCTGYYNIKATVEGRLGFYQSSSVSYAHDAFGSLHWVIREVTGATTSVEVNRVELYNGQVGFDSRFRLVHVSGVYTAVVYLEAGKEYIIDELEVNLQSYAPTSQLVTLGYDKRIQSSISVYLNADNECVNKNSSNRSVVADIEGSMDLAQWQKLRANKGLRLITKGCNAQIIGHIDEMKYNSANCWVSGSILGALLCLDGKKHYRED